VLAGLTPAAPDEHFYYTDVPARVAALSVASTLGIRSPRAGCAGFDGGSPFPNESGTAAKISIAARGGSTETPKLGHFRCARTMSVIAISFALGRSAASTMHPADAKATHRWSLARLPCPLRSGATSRSTRTWGRCRLSRTKRLRRRVPEKSRLACGSRAFTTTSTPMCSLRRGHAYCGVGKTLSRTSGIVRSSSARENISLTPEILEPHRRQLRIPHRMLDVSMSKVSLEGSRVVASVRQRVAASMPEHMRVRLERQLRHSSCSFNHASEACGREW
jgi:hypothetical protein